MRIGVLGINHKSANLCLRENLAKACYKRLNIESNDAEKLSCVLLFTCHRTEIYFSADDLAAAHSTLLHILREEVFFPFEHKLYAYFGCDCFAHLARVTAGLDSMIIGESEIQRQVKQAYEQTCLHYALPGSMHYLFQKSLQLGKYLRSHFSLARGQITIPRIIHELCMHLFTDLEESRVLFIGNSEINRKVLAYFKYKKMSKISLCTRSIFAARDLALRHQLELLEWSGLSQWRNYDIVISGTNASSFLIYSDIETRQTRLIFDLGLPRNIDPKFARDPRTTLLNIDELGAMIEKRQIKHLEIMKESEAILQEKVHLYYEIFKEKRMPLCV